MNKPILCLDFDGVVHSYKSGWKGASVIPDPPVDGAIEFIARAQCRFTVAVFSSRSHQWGGRRAMKRWLKNWFIAKADSVNGDVAEEINAFVLTDMAMDPWDVVLDDAGSRFVRGIRFPLFKPPAMVGLDDRVLTFDGNWPNVEQLARFKPWNKR